MIIVDTNGVPELTQAAPATTVTSWIRAQSADERVVRRERAGVPQPG